MTNCSIWSLEMKAFSDYKRLHDSLRTIVTNGAFDDINNPTFKLLSQEAFDLHHISVYFIFNIITKCESGVSNIEHVL